MMIRDILQIMITVMDPMAITQKIYKPSQKMIKNILRLILINHPVN